MKTLKKNLQKIFDTIDKPPYGRIVIPCSVIVKVFTIKLPTCITVGIIRLYGFMVIEDYTICLIIDKGLDDVALFICESCDAALVIPVVVVGAGLAVLVDVELLLLTEVSVEFVLFKRVQRFGFVLIGGDTQRGVGAGVVDDTGEELSVAVQDRDDIGFVVEVMAGLSIGEVLRGVGGLADASVQGIVGVAVAFEEMAMEFVAPTPLKNPPEGSRMPRPFLVSLPAKTYPPLSSVRVCLL